MDIITYSLSKKYIEDSLKGVGALKGKNCTISSIEPVEGGNKITFSWTLDDGTQKIESLIVMDGKDGSGNDGYSKEEVDEKISKAIEDAIIGDIDLSDYDTSEEVDEKINEKFEEVSKSIVVPMYDEEDESIKFVSGSAPSNPNTGSGASVITSATVPTNSTVGNVGDMMLVTTTPLRLYILGSIEDNKYNWTCIAGENVVFEDVETEDSGNVNALELTTATLVNSGYKGAVTPYIPIPELSTLTVTTNTNYKVGITRSTTGEGTPPTENVSASANSTATATRKAPYNQPYVYIVIRGSNGHVEIDDIVANSDAIITLKDDQDEVIAEYKLVNKVVG